MVKVIANGGTVNNCKQRLMSAEKKCNKKMGHFSIFAGYNRISVYKNYSFYT